MFPLQVSYTAWRVVLFAVETTMRTKNVFHNTFFLGNDLVF